ncbi:hypothetical protein B0H13DRAFT_1874300 [Mycena leptocephala]|nr:hypothetical protein B0H13DRAFT_1874300 [Mycena leptocephala]
MRGLVFIGIALLSSVVGVFGTSVCVTVGDPATCKAFCRRCCAVNPGDPQCVNPGPVPDPCVGNCKGVNFSKGFVQKSLGTHVDNHCLKIFIPNANYKTLAANPSCIPRAKCALPESFVHFGSWLIGILVVENHISSELPVGIEATRVTICLFCL